jgi:hypothetical protein
LNDPIPSQNDGSARTGRRDRFGSDPGSKAHSRPTQASLADVEDGNHNRRGRRGKHPHRLSGLGERLGPARAIAGTSQTKFAEGILAQLAALNLNEKGTVDGKMLAFNLALAQGTEPIDEIEGMLAAQMAAIHRATMDCAGRMARTKSAESGESYERSLNRLGRELINGIPFDLRS